jgi:hypothetical protein
MDTGSGAKDYRICVQKSGIKLPTGYYFGVSVSYSIVHLQYHNLTCILLGCFTYTCW